MRKISLLNASELKRGRSPGPRPRAPGALLCPALGHSDGPVGVPPPDGGQVGVSHFPWISLCTVLSLPVVDSQTSIAPICSYDESQGNQRGADVTALFSLAGFIHRVTVTVMHPDGTVLARSLGTALCKCPCRSKDPICRGGRPGARTFGGRLHSPRF